MDILRFYCAAVRVYGDNSLWLASGQMQYEFYGIPYLLMKLTEEEETLDSGRFDLYNSFTNHPYEVEIIITSAFNDCDDELTPIIDDLASWVRSNWSIRTSFDGMDFFHIRLLFSFTSSADAVEFKLKWT